jgi:hypothetical protein
MKTIEYEILQQNGARIVKGNPVVIENDARMTFGIHFNRFETIDSGKRYAVTHIESGLMAGCGKSRDEAIDDATTRIVEAQQRGTLARAVKMKVLGLTAKDVIATIDHNGLHADFVGEVVSQEPVLKPKNVAATVAADAPVNITALVADADHESRAAAAEFFRRVRMTDAETFNQFCVEYGWLELRVDCGDDRVPSVAAVEFFHKRFGDLRTRDPLETLSYLFKYVSAGGFDGVSASADWLIKVREYIARLKASRLPIDTNVTFE